MTCSCVGFTWYNGWERTVTNQMAANDKHLCASDAGLSSSTKKIFQGLKSPQAFLLSASCSEINPQGSDQRVHLTPSWLRTEICQEAEKSQCKWNQNSQHSCSLSLPEPISRDKNWIFMDSLFRGPVIWEDGRLHPLNNYLNISFQADLFIRKRKGRYGVWEKKITG